MDKVVLVYPKIEFEENYPNSWIPYSILALASSIKDKDVEIKIFDQNKNSDAEYIDYIKENKDEILSVGFSIMTGGAQIKNSLDLAKIAKEQGLITVFGGPHVNVLPEQTAKHELVDYALKGIGQFQFPLFIDAIRNKKTMQNIPNIYYYEDNNLRIGPDVFPKGLYLPNYDLSLIDISQYIQNDNTINSRTINYIASQGCPYTCKFCYETCYKRKYFKLEEKGIIDDIDKLVKEHNVNGLKFYDADWFVDVKRSIRLCDTLENYNIGWAASINPRDILRTQNGSGNELLQKAKDSGCTRLLMGMESGNDRVLQEIVDKRVTKDELKHVAKLISQYGILGSYTFIVGFPNESKEEINDTLEFVKSLWDLETKPETRVHIYTPYPGTELFDDAVNLGFIAPDNLEDWSVFDYYKAMTPWTDSSLEEEVKECTMMVEKKRVRK